MCAISSVCQAVASDECREMTTTTTKKLTNCAHPKRKYTASILFSFFFVLSHQQFIMTLCSNSAIVIDTTLRCIMYWVDKKKKNGKSLSLVRSSNDGQLVNAQGLTGVGVSLMNYTTSAWNKIYSVRVSRIVAAQNG